jgi:hypothetical protein
LRVATAPDPLARRRSTAVSQRWPWIWGAAILGVVAHASVFPHTHTLFDLYALGSRRWWAGQPIYLEPLTSLFIYRYSPLFAVAITPFARLPEHVGSAAWKLTNALVYLAGLRLWIGAAAPRTPSPTVTGVFLVLTLALSAISLYDGQANLMLVGFAMAAIAMGARQRWRIAGGLVALATLIKAYPVALALLLAPLSGAFLVSFAVAFGAGLLLPLVCQQPAFAIDQTFTWFRLLAETGGVRQVSSQSIDLLWTMTGRSVLPRAYNVLSALAGAAALALFVRLRNSADRRALLFEIYAAFALWVALFGPTSEPSTFVVLAPVAAWCTADAFDRNRPRAWRALLVASLMLLGPLATTLFGAGVQLWAGAHGCLSIGSAALGAYVVSHHGDWSDRVDCDGIPART